MAANPDSLTDPFDCFWRIQNFSACPHKQDDYMDSLVWSIDGTEWRLSVYPRGDMVTDYVSCYLFRSSDDLGPDKVLVKYEISILLAKCQRSSFYKKVNSRVFMKGEGFGSKRFAEREEILRQRNLYLPEDTLTLRCRMRLKRNFDDESTRALVSHLYGQSSAETEQLCESVGQTMLNMKRKFDSRPNSCTIRSRVGVVKGTFTWCVERFVSWKQNRKLSMRMASVSKSSPLLLFTFYIDDDDAIRIDVSIANKVSGNQLIAVRCEVAILDKWKYVFCRTVDERLFQSGDTDSIWTLPKLINRSELVANKNLDLQNGDLTFKFKIAMSDGVISSWFENFSCASPDLSPKDRKESANLLRVDLQCMYHNREFCDLTLRVKGETFEAHKAVVCSRSPYFRAMMETDMKEKSIGIVDIKDVDPRTVDRMLKYLYTDVVDDQLSWEDIASLFSYADLCEILPMKRTCSSLLRNSLSLDNVLGILEHANLHQDGNLKDAALDYICTSARAVLKSEEWNDFVKQNPKLAGETLSCITNAILEC